MAFLCIGVLHFALRRFAEITHDTGAAEAEAGAEIEIEAETEGTSLTHSHSLHKLAKFI